MADVFEAYKVLNEALNLGLDTRSLARAEALYKNRFAREAKFAVEGNLSQDWEFISYLAPRRKELSEDARQMLQELQSEIDSESYKA